MPIHDYLGTKQINLNKLSYRELPSFVKYLLKTKEKETNIRTLQYSLSQIRKSWMHSFL